MIVQRRVMTKYTKAQFINIRENMIRIQNHYALSPRIFPNAAETTSRVFKGVSPVNNVEILSLCL